MKKLYGGLRMNWIHVILFALVAGAYTGFVMLIPALKDTSFQDIGVLYEWWVIFAVLIVVNCKKSWEAMLKCFVFFAISQPLVFFVEGVFGNLSYELGINYLRSWMLPILMTLPGGFIAYHCKKQSVPGAVILGLGNSIQAFMGMHYVSEVINNFPHHFLSAVVCFLSIAVMTLSIQQTKRNRIIAILIPIVAMILALLFLKLTGRVL